MAFLVLGILLLALKVLEVGAVGELSWWIILSPFAAAVLWWWWADFSGLTKRREMEKNEERKVDRRRKNVEALGLKVTRRKR